MTANTIACLALVTSELYSRNVNPYIEDGYVNVYYSTTGEYWIDIPK